MYDCVIEGLRIALDGSDAKARVFVNDNPGGDRIQIVPLGEVNEENYPGLVEYRYQCALDYYTNDSLDVRELTGEIADIKSAINENVALTVGSTYYYHDARIDLIDYTTPEEDREYAARIEVSVTVSEPV